jgi:hypothetical protein
VEASDGLFQATNSVHVTVTQVNQLVDILPLNSITIPAGQHNCYNAIQSILVAGDGTIFVVQDGGSVDMIAGQHIKLLPGTKGHAGSYLHAYITTTGAYCCSTILPVQAVMHGELTGIEAADETSLFKVYPNPTTGKLTLDMKGIDESSVISVEIYGMLGNTVLKTEVSGSKQYVFDLSGKPHGFYLIRVINGSEMGMSKIIKH